MRRFSSVPVPSARISAPAGNAARTRCCHSARLGTSGTFRQDAVDAAEAVQRALCCRDIHHDGRLAAVGIRVNASDCEFADLIVDQQKKVIARFFAQACADPDTVRALQLMHRVFGLAQTTRLSSDPRSSPRYLRGCLLQPDRGRSEEVSVG